MYDILELDWTTRSITPGTLTLRAERRSARMSKITNDGLTRSGTECLIAVPTWQQWASNWVSFYGSNICIVSHHIVRPTMIVVVVAMCRGDMVDRCDGAARPSVPGWRSATSFWRSVTSLPTVSHIRRCSTWSVASNSRFRSHWPGNHGRTTNQCLADGRSRLRYSVASVRPSICLSSVTYVLWVNSVFYRKKLSEEAHRNGLSGIEWSRDRWRRVTLISNALGLNISKTVGAAI